MDKVEHNSHKLISGVEQGSAKEISDKLANRLRNLRRDAGLSQEKVAFAAGLSAYTYQKYEKGESKPGTPLNPCLHTLVALANTFDITLVDLLSFDN